MALFETDSAVGVFCQLPRVGAEGGQLHGLDSATLQAGKDAVNTACRETPTSRWLQRTQIAGKMLPRGERSVEAGVGTHIISARIGGGAVVFKIS